MQAADPAHRAARTIEIAGTAWPLYKLEALVAAGIVFLLLAVVVQSLQVAVLAAAAIAVVVWIAGLARQAPRSE